VKNNYWKSKAVQFDSKFEEALAGSGLLREAEYHPDDKIVYQVEHKYTTDWKYFNGHKVYLIESKGRFMDRAEATKYVYIRNNLSKDTELIFLFQNPKVKMPGAKPRKDGTTQTMAEWADRNKFKWYIADTIREGVGMLKDEDSVQKFKELNKQLRTVKSRKRK